MKFLTKEWLHALRLSSAGRNVEVSYRARLKDERFFRTLYDKRCNCFLCNEMENESYRDTEKELKKIDKFVNAPGISEGEHERRLQYKEDYIKVNEISINNGVYFVFDKAVSEKRFEVAFKRKVELLKSLPKTILLNVADIRVLALGYASSTVKARLKPFCEKLSDNCMQIKDEVISKIEKVESYLSKRVYLNELFESLLTEVIEEDGNVILSFHDGDRLIIKDGIITERDSQIVFPFNEDDPNSGWTKVLSVELDRVEGKFEVSFLFENLNMYDESELWYLTILGRDLEYIEMPEEDEE